MRIEIVARRHLASFLNQMPGKRFGPGGQKMSSFRAGIGSACSQRGKVHTGSDLTPTKSDPGTSLTVVQLGEPGIELLAKSGAVEQITYCLVEGTRRKERAALVRNALVKLLPQTWDARCEFARFVIGNCEPAESIQRLTQARLADSLENLLLGFAQADGYLRELVQGT